MDVAVHPLMSRRYTKNLSPYDPRLNCTGKWRRTSSSTSTSSSSSSSSPSPNCFLKNCNGSWRRTSSPIPELLKNFNATTSQRRRHPSLPHAFCTKQLSVGPKILIIKRGEDLPESLKTCGESKIFSTDSNLMAPDPPSPSSLPVPSFLGNKKKVTFNIDDQALDVELLEFGFIAASD